MTNPRATPGVEIAQIFLEKVEFSHRPDWLMLPHNTPAVVGQVDVKLEVATNESGDQGMVRIEVSTKAENNPMYSFLVGYIAIVTKPDMKAGLELAKYLQHSGPLLLYPFLRQTVADLTLKGRFGPIWLSPFAPGAFAGAAPPKEATPPSKSQKKPARRRARR